MPINKMDVTVLIATKNEELNLRECLKSIKWADQILVIDSGSTDQTEAIAKEFDADFRLFNYKGGWPKKRNWALQSGLVKNHWVLILDADERVSPQLRDDIKSAIRDPNFDGYYIKWKFVFLGKWMKHSWSHGWMMRLFRSDKGEYENLQMTDEGGWDAEVHENVVVEGSCGKLPNCLDHESSHDLHRWIQKQNEFSTWNAKRRIEQLNLPLPGISSLFSDDPLKRRKWMKAFFLRLPGKPWLMFAYLYFIKMGFLDGLAGFYFCCLRASHELNINAKVFEHRLESTSQQNEGS
jgi:glycosyltransferase involved in cell wall biosynthesis